MLGKTVTLQYNTGSDITVIDKREQISIGSLKLSVNNVVEHAGGNKLDIIGKFCCAIHALNREGDIYIHVALRNTVNLFALNAIDCLNLWSVPLTELRQSSCALGVQHTRTSTHPIAASSVNSSRTQLSVRMLSSKKQEITPQDNTYYNGILQRYPNLFSEGLNTCRDFKVKFSLVDNKLMPPNSLRYENSTSRRIGTPGIQRYHRKSGYLILDIAYCHRKKTKWQTTTMRRFLNGGKQCIIR